MPDPISDQELKAIVNSEIRSAMGEITGEIANERAEAMDYYYGEPIGRLYQPNMDRSSIVITTLRDTVEWMMPQLMRMFAQADKVVEFEPVGADDEEKAEQETQAINHVFWRQNEGFLILYTWFKDALLQKNGTVKYWIEETEDRDREEYDGLTDMALSQLLEDEEYEVIERYESDVRSMDGQPLHHVVVEKTGVTKTLKVMNVPPEEFLISEDAQSLDVHTERPRMVGHHTEKTRSQLLAMGFSKSDVEDMMKGDDDEERYDAEWTSRYHYSDEQQVLTGGSDYGHESQKKTVLYELYMDLDRDGDGHAELLKIYRAGQFLEWEETDHVPFACLTPYINPHKHFGLSEYDMVHDLQEIATQIFRNLLDNMYQTNNMRPVVDADKVDLDSLLVSRPGAPIYCEETGGTPVNQLVQPFAPPPMWEHGLSLLEYLDQIRKDRTGIADETMGLDANTIANANTGVMLEAMEAARGKIELVARIFAETGIKWLFRGLHELARKSYDQELRYELSGQYISVNPQEWRKRNNLTINVGTASGSQQRELMRLMTIGDIQMKMHQAGGMGVTVLPMHFYQTAKDIAENLGAKDGDKYFLDPLWMFKNPEMQQIIQAQLPQQGPDPQTQLLQANAMIERDKVQATREKAQAEHQIKQAELVLKREEMEIRQNIEALKAELSNLQAAAKNQTEIEKVRTNAQAKEIDQMLKALESRLQAQMDKYRTDMQSFTQFGTKAMDVAMDEMGMVERAEMRAEETRKLAEQEDARAKKIRQDIEAAEVRAQQEREAALAEKKKLDKAAEQSQQAQEALAQANETIAGLMDKLEEMKSEMSRPRKVERDGSGRPVSIDGKPITYDSNGNIEQIG